MRHRRGCCLMMAIGLLAARCGAAVSYSVTDLGALHSPGGSQALAINSAGQIAGISTANSNFAHAFLYAAGVGMKDLGAFAFNSGASGINDLGHVVGTSETPGAGAQHPFLWTTATGMVDISAQVGSTAVPDAINNAGQIVGRFATGTTDHAFLYIPGNGTTDLGTLSGVAADASEATAVNASGVVAGWSYQLVNVGRTVQSLPHAFIYVSGQMTDLGTLGGTGNFSQSWAYAINALGHIAGDSYTNQFQKDAFLYTPGVGMTDLGSFGNGANVLGVNDLDQLVGYTDPVPGGVSHAFVYNPGVGFTQLNLLIPANSGWNLTEATAINNAGQIVGYGTNPSGATDAFLLTPLPEPTAAGLLAVGAAMLLRRSRKRTT